MNFSNDVLLVMMLSILTSATDTDLNTNTNFLLMLLLILSMNTQNNTGCNSCFGNSGSVISCNR